MRWGWAQSGHPIFSSHLARHLAQHASCLAHSQKTSSSTSAPPLGTIAEPETPMPRHIERPRPLVLPAVHLLLLLHPLHPLHLT
jgi:hypothetical protein